MTAPINAAVLGYRGTTLATITDTFEIIYQFPNSQATILDLTTGGYLLSPVVARSQDGGVTFATNRVTSLYLGSTPVGTSIGPLIIDPYFVEGTFYSALDTSAPSSVAEPSTLALLATGTLGVFRRFFRRSLRA